MPQCNVDCGEGEKTRDVWCGESGTSRKLPEWECELPERPVRTTKCDMGVCLPRTWLFTDWSPHVCIRTADYHYVIAVISVLLNVGKGCRPERCSVLGRTPTKFQKAPATQKVNPNPSNLAMNTDPAVGSGSPVHGHL